MLLTEGRPEYRISALYLEFENVDAPDDTVVTPAFGRDAAEGVDYYDGLASSPNRDYLRVPIVAARRDITDAVKFPKTNAPTFFAMTSGTEGVHGKTFSDSVNSTVYGGALVAMVNEGDPTQDLVFSRFYLPTNAQQAKTPTSQVGLEWALELQ
jgi:hypothetical protein